MEEQTQIKVSGFRGRKEGKSCVKAKMVRRTGTAMVQLVAQVDGESGLDHGGALQKVETRA